MGKRNAAAAIVDADRLQQFETPPKRMKHGPSNAAPPPATAAAAPAREPYSPNISVSEFTLSKEFVDGTKLMDLTLKQWRIGKPIGKGSFGEIFLASDDIDTPVTSENAKYVVKIEPHSNGPLFVEIHCLLNTAKPTETCIIPPGMPEYIASGSHIFENERYRFLILKRYQRDLHSLIKNKRVNPTSIPVIACQILDVLEHLHDQGYVHSDIKAENLMIGTVETDRKDASVRLSNGSHHQNGHDHHRPNGVTLPPEGGRVGRGRGKKATAEVPVAVNGTAHPPENGLYYHQEQEMCTRTRNLRPLKTVTYRDLSDEDERGGGARSKAAGSLPKRRGRKRNNDASFSCSISPRRSGYEELKAATEEAHRQELKRNSLPKVDEQQQQQRQQQGPEEERIHLIDFGLASKFVDSNGQHRPFCMDQRRAHDGTLEFTSRDAHMGAHARRSDLECLGYNLVYWSRGFLPWKDEKLLNQPEQVHRMKEYFMADVREMLRLIYGDDCPAYLGEFLAYVGNLTYDERPDYQYCKSLFYKELKRLGSPVSRHQPLRLDVEAIVQLSEPLTAQDEAEITNKINHVKSLMKMGALIPYRESMLHSKASSPKNLRSKRGDANGRNAQSLTVTDGAAATPATQPVPSAVCTRKKEKQFSCADIFATDADQIARDRVEKEFERAEQMEETVIRYSGKPTYAIQELLERKSRGYSLGSGLEYTESEGYIKGYTKPMMDILRKRQSQLFRQIEEMNSAGKNKKEAASDGDGNTAPMEQEGGDEEEDEEDDEEEEEDEEEVEEDEEMEAAPDNELENEEDEEEEVKLSKYEQDDDYEQAAEDEDEDDSVEDDDDEEEVASEEEEAEEESVEEDDEEEDDEEAVEEDEEEEAEGGAVVQNGYESRGSYRRKKESKGRKKEDTDSDFINDGGCEEEEEEEEEEEGAETDACNLPDADEQAVDDAEEEEANDDDQQDSDFNDQESTATESDVIIVPVKRRPGRKRKEPPQPQAAHDSRDDRGGIVTGRRKVGRPRKHSSSKNTDIHDHREEEASDSSRAKVATGSSSTSSKQRSDHRKKERKERRRQQRREVLDDGEGDNARLFGDHQREDEVEEAVDGREAVRKQTHHPYNNNNHCNSKAYYGDVDDSSHDMTPPTGTGEDLNASKYRFVKRRKSGLRERIRPTDRGTDYADNLQRKRKAALQNKQRRESAALHGELEDEEGADSEALLPSPSGVEDDSSCSSSSSSSTGTSHSVSSSCSVGNRSSRAISHSSSAASLASSSSIVPAQKRRGRKRKQPPPLVSSRDSSGTRQSSTAQCAISSTVRSRRQPTVTDSEATGGHSNNRWGRSNSNSSQSAATSRASSVSASANGASEYAAQHHQQSHHHHHHHQLVTLPEQQDDFLDDDDGDDTRDVDYSPVCTRRRRKEAAGGNGTVSRKHGTTTTIRRKHDSKGLVGKGLGTAPPSPPSPTLPPPPPPPLAASSSSSSSSSSAVNGGGTGVNLPPLSSISRRLDNTIQPPPPPPVPPVAALIQHHHQQQQQHQRGRRPQHHHMAAYQNYYRVNDQHHLPSTMLVRTYSRG